MAKFSKTKKQSTFTKTEYKLTDEELQKKNSEAAGIVQQYDEKIASGGYLSAEDLYGYQEAQRTYIDTGNAIRKRLTENGYKFTDADEADWATQVAGLNERYDKVYGVYSPHTSEDSWKAYLAEIEQHKADLEYDTEAGRVELAEIHKQIDAAKKDIPGTDYYANILPRKYGLVRPSDAKLKVQDLETQAKELEDRIVRAEGLQAVAELESYSDPTSQNYDPDFEEKSVYDPTKRSPKKAGGILGLTSTYDSDPYLLYAAINGDKDAIAQLQANAGSSGASSPEGYNPLGGVYFSTTEGKHELVNMDEKEKKTYNYLAHEYGIAKANEYYALIRSDLFARERYADLLEMQAYTKEHPRAASVSTWLMAPLKGLSYMGQAIDYIDDGRIDENAPYNKFTYTGSDIRNTRSGMIEESWDSALGEGWGKVGSWGYQLGMSMGDFVMATAVSGGNQFMSLAIMGTGAAADTTIAAKQRGLSDDQAFALGTVAGAAEVITEKIGLDALFDVALKGKGALVYTLKNAFSEGLEEPTSSVINTLADLIISGDKAELRERVQEYKDAGYTDGQALGKVFGEYALSLGSDALGGMLSGGFMAIPGTISQSTQYRDVGAQIIKKGTASELKAAADTLGVGTKKFNLSKPGQVGQLYYTVAEKISESGKEALTGEMVKNGVSQKAATKLSGVIIDAWMGVEVDESGMDLIASALKDDNITGAMEVVLNGEDSPVRIARAQLAGVMEGTEVETVAEDTAEKTPEPATESAPETFEDVQVEDGALEDVEQEMAPEEVQGETVAENHSAVDSAIQGYISNGSVTNRTAESILADPQALDYLQKETGVLITGSVAQKRAAVKAAVTQLAKQTKKGKRTIAPKESEQKAEPKKSEQTTEKKVDMEGKTFVESSGEEVKSISVKRIGKGGAVVTVNGGTEAKLSDVSFGDERTHLAYSRVTSVEGMTAEAANKILNNPKADRFDFINEAIRAFQGGLRNESVAEKLDYDIISADEARALFEEGRKAAAAQAQAAQDLLDEIYQKAKAEVEKTGKKVNAELRYADDLEIDELLEDERGDCARLAARMVPALKGDIVLYDGPQDGKMGYYKYSEDAIYLNVNAKFDEKSMMAFVLAHEMVHRGRKGAALKYQAFADLLIQEFTKKGVSLDVLIQEQLDAAKAAKVKMTEPQAFEEVICDACQRMLVDTNAGRILAEWGAQNEENRSFLKKLKAFLTELFDRLRKVFAGERSENRAVAAFRALDKSVQNMLAEMYVDMTKDAAEKLSVIKAAGMLDKTNTTGEGGVRYSIVKSFVDNNGVSYKDAVLLDSEFFNDLKPHNWGKKLAKFVDFRSNNYPLILPVQDENGVYQQLEFAKVTDRVYGDNNSPHRVLNELSQTTDNISKLSVIHIDEIVEISEADNPYFTVRNPNHSHKWLDQNGWLHRTAHVINSKNGAIYKIVVDIAKAADGRHIMYATKGKINRVGTVLVNSLVTRGSGLNTNSNVSLAQQDTTVKRKDLEYLFAVDQKDMKTAQRMVDEAAREAGYPIRAWHGTPIKGITVFDPKKIGSTTDDGIFGSGFYFTTNKITADGYASDTGATMPVFLRGRKPWWGLGHSVQEVAKLLDLDESILTVRKTALGSIVAPLPKYAKTFSAHLTQRGYDSVIIQHGAHNYEIVVFDNTMIKSADPVTYDDEGNVIPLSQRFNPESDDIRRKLPVGISSRVALVDALEGLARRDEEKRLLNTYRTYIKNAQADQERLVKTRKEIARLRKEGDPNKRIPKLQQAVKTIQARLDRNDSALLELEGMEILKGIMERAVREQRQMGEAQRRQMSEQYRADRADAVALQKATDADLRAMEQEFLRLMREYEKQGAKRSQLEGALAGKTADYQVMEKEFLRLMRAYEKESAKRVGLEADVAELGEDLESKKQENRDLRENQKLWEAEFRRLMTAYDRADRQVDRLEEQIQQMRESRRRASERRKASEVRGKIKRLKARMQSTLLNPSEKSFVPVSLFETMVSVLELVDDSAEQYKRNGTLNQAQAAREATASRLNKLSRLYSEFKGTDGYQGEFDEYVDSYLRELADKYEGKNLAEMGLEELEEMYEILKSIQDVIMDARNLIGMNERYDVYEATDAIAAEQQAITDGRKNGKRNFVGIANDTMNNHALSPMRNIERMSGYDEDSMLVKLFRDIEKGVRKGNLFMMRAYKMFEELTASPEYDDALYKEVTVDGKPVEYTDYKGRKFGLSKMQMMQAILSYEREQAVDNLNHIATGGFTFADLRMLRKGKLKEAISEENSHRVPAATEMVLEFIEILKDDKWCQDYMAVAREFFNHMAKDAINEASIATKHRAVATGEAYVPFETDQNFVVKEISAANDVQQTINSYGMLKDTQNNAPQPLIVTGLNNLIERHISQVGTVYGLAVPIRNFNKVWTTKTQPGVDGAPTVRGLIEGNWGTKGAAHIEQAVQDVQGPRKRDQGVFADLYRKLKSNYIGATFLFNLSVVMKQLGSLFTATSMIQWRNPVSMMANLIYTATHFQEIAAEVDQYTASVWMRRQGLSDAELSTLMTEGQKTWLGKLAKKGPAWANPTKWITGMDSAVALSLWRYCKEDVAARTGLEGEALLEATAEFFDDVVENTQSMTDVLHRPEIQKNTSIFSEPFAMFKTDVYQMAGQLNVAAGRAFANPTKENKRALSKTVYSIAMSAVWGRLMSAAFDALRYKMGRYKDDEDELTWKSFLKRSLFSLGGDLAGYVFPIFGSEIVGIGEALAYGETDDFLDNMTMSNVNELYSMIISISNAMIRGKDVSPQKWNKLIAKALQLFGVPTSNIIRLWEAIRKHAADIAEGEFFAFNEE